MAGCNHSNRNYLSNDLLWREDTYISGVLLILSLGYRKLVGLYIYSHENKVLRKHQ